MVCRTIYLAASIWGISSIPSIGTMMVDQTCSRPLSGFGNALVHAGCLNALQTLIWTEHNPVEKTINHKCIFLQATGMFVVEAREKNTKCLKIPKPFYTTTGRVYRAIPATHSVFTGVAPVCHQWGWADTPPPHHTQLQGYPIWKSGFRVPEISGECGHCSWAWKAVCESMVLLPQLNNAFYYSTETG